MLNSAILNFMLPEKFNHEEFRQLANVFFQAEGCVSARIKGLYISPVVVLTQNLSNESLVFFVTLWYYLGKVGSLSISISPTGKFVIRLASESWKDVLDVFMNCFNLLNSNCHSYK